MQKQIVQNLTNVIELVQIQLLERELVLELYLEAAITDWKALKSANKREHLVIKHNNKLTTIFWFKILQTKLTVINNSLN